MSTLESHVRPLERPLRHGRGRRPVAQVREYILGAAAETLFARGVAAFTIDEVAKRSGASKTTIYKWWPSKGARALDGYFHKVETELSFPDSGDIQADLRAQLRAFVHVMTATPAGAVMAELIGLAQSDPDLKAAYLERYTAPRRALAVDVLTRAQQRGQLSASVDPEIVVDQLWGACYYRFLLPTQTLDDRFIDGLVGNLFHGVSADL